MFSADCESMEIMGIYNSDEVWQATKNMKYKMQVPVCLTYWDKDVEADVF